MFLTMVYKVPTIWIPKFDLFKAIYFKTELLAQKPFLENWSLQCGHFNISICLLDIVCKKGLFAWKRLVIKEGLNFIRYVKILQSKHVFDVV